MVACKLHRRQTEFESFNSSRMQHLMANAANQIIFGLQNYLAPLLFKTSSSELIQDINTAGDICDHLSRMFTTLTSKLWAFGPRVWDSPFICTSLAKFSNTLETVYYFNQGSRNLPFSPANCITSR